MTKMCDKCKTLNDETDKFCAECGHQLQCVTITKNLCKNCIPDEEGFCLDCGKKVVSTTTKLKKEQQNQFIISDCLGLITDIGLRHKVNEDFGSIMVHENKTIMIVCDGVSSSWKPQLASKKATEVVMNYLINNSEDYKLRMENAIKKAHHEIQKINNTLNSSETTIVAVIKDNERCIVGWVGDSRLYEIKEEEIIQITIDDSWIEELIKKGKTYAEAKLDKLAHAITQTLGMEDEPNVNIKEFSSSNSLMICSDGLWNYLETNDELFKFYNPIKNNSIELILKSFVNYANENGGIDNITLGILKK